jgi:hypothetical protein
MGTLSLGGILTLLAVGFNPTEDIPHNHFDLVEVNHFLDANGRLVFEQVIFYQWSRVSNRYQVQAWRLIKSEAQLPQYDSARHQYIARWFDGEQLREISAQQLRETWTQKDPEVVERKHLPKELRYDLAKKIRKPAKKAPVQSAPEEIVRK